MVVTNTPRAAGPYFGNDVTTTFAYGFRVLNEAGLEVRLSEAGVPTVVLTLDVDYTVTGVDEDTGGDVVLTTPLATGQRLDIIGAAAYAQPLALENQGPYFARDIMRALDRIVIQTQQLAEAVNRAVVIPPEDDVTDIDALIASVTALDAIRDDLSALAAIIADITTVAGIDADVTAVAAINTAVSTVAAISASVTAVAGNAANINAVAAITAAVTAVAAIDDAVTAVAAITAEVAAVAAIDADVTTVAGIAADVTTVATNAATLVAIAADVSTVAGIAADVTTVAGIAADVSTVAANVSAILAALAGAVQRTSATGSAILPTGTTAQRDVTPAAGYIRFNTTTLSFEGYNGTSWAPVGGGGQFKGNNGTVGIAPGDIFRVNSKTLTVSTTIAATENAQAAGPLEVANGVTLTVDTGGNLVIT
ncbi:hypothetical protein [Nostoc phage Nsp-JY18]